jgi:3-methyladenine DNA glycosylase AlkD
MSRAATAETPPAARTRGDTPGLVASHDTKAEPATTLRDRAKQLGRHLGTLIDDVDRFAEAARSALDELADDAYRRELQRVAPGVRGAVGVRSPLLVAVVTGLAPTIRSTTPSEALWVAERLTRSDELELRQLAIAFLRRSLPDDPERTWQLIRRLGRRAQDWISVDSLGFIVAEGILREPYRWSEIEQLVFAESPWERRLAAASVAEARSTARDLAARRIISSPLTPMEVKRGLNVVASLIGDGDPNVRKALSWALRELAPVDREQVTAFMSAQAERAAAEKDGNRAWVLRDALGKLAPADAEALRSSLQGLRRAPRADSTSTASGIAARFGRLPDPRTMPEPPL